jgi:hypothetical protein
MGVGKGVFFVIGAKTDPKDGLGEGRGVGIGVGFGEGIGVGFGVGIGVGFGVVLTRTAIGTGVAVGRTLIFLFVVGAGGFLSFGLAFGLRLGRQRSKMFDCFRKN